MRSFIALFLFGFVCETSVAQVYLNHGSNFEVSFNKILLDPCNQSNPTNSFEFGAAMDDVGGQLIANDLFVMADEIFTLEQIQLNIWSASGVIAVDVIIWDDDNSLPGTQLFSELNLVPTSQTFVANLPNGFNAYDTVLDLPTPFELEGGTGGSTYWLQIVGYASSGAYTGWESTTQSFQGNQTAYNLDGTWQNDSNIDGSYVFSGDCSPALGTDDVFVSNISLYPNPTNGMIHVQTPNSMTIKDVKMYNLVGQIFAVELSNNTLDLTHFSNGIYLLDIATSDGRIVKKIIKK